MDLVFSTAPSSPILASRPASSCSSQQSQTADLPDPRRRALAGTSGGIFRATSSPDTSGFRYVWPQPPRYSAVGALVDSPAYDVFSATVETEHEERVSRPEGEGAVARALDRLAGSAEQDYHGERRGQSIVEDATGLVRPTSSPPTLPQRHPSRGSVARIEDEEDRLETMSINSEDTFSDVSYTTADLERDLGAQGKQGPKSKLRKVGASMKFFDKAFRQPLKDVSSRANLALKLRKSKLLKRDQEQDAGGSSDGPSSFNDACGMPVPPSHFASSAQLSDRPPTLSADTSLPRPPSNTPTTPHRLRCRTQQCNTRPASQAPARRNPLRLHPDVMDFATPASPGKLNAAIGKVAASQAVDQLTDGHDEEQEQIASETFFGQSPDLRGEAWRQWEDEALGRRSSF